MIAKIHCRVAASAIAAAVFTTAPAVALQGACMRTGRHVFAGGAPLANPGCESGFRAPAFGRHPRHFHNFVLVDRPIFYVDGAYGNYCWQQVWTSSGWQWADACAGNFAFSH